MKIIRGETENGIACGCIGESGAIYRISGDALDPGQMLEEPLHFQRVLSPITPVAIWGIGLNYRGQANLLAVERPHFPLLFAKQPSSLQHPGQPIWLPSRLPAEVDFEGELAVVIGRACRNVEPADALGYVAGYTCANDVSARDWQQNKQWSGGQFTRAKSFDGFCPLGPCLVTPESLPNPGAVRLRTYLNGELAQDDHTSNLIFDVPYLISFLSADTTLVPGTVILTGTPGGNLLGRQPPRWLREGDRVDVEIEGIGRLTNPVAASNAPPFTR